MSLPFLLVSPPNTAPTPPADVLLHLGQNGILKNFTPEQKRIRSEWRSRFAKKVSEKDAEQAIKEFQQMMAKAFG